jgi:hypothetical protein
MAEFANIAQIKFDVLAKALCGTRIRSPIAPSLVQLAMGMPHQQPRGRLPSVTRTRIFNCYGSVSVCLFCSVERSIHFVVGVSISRITYLCSSNGFGGGMLDSNIFASRWEHDHSSQYHDYINMNR